MHDRLVEAISDLLLHSFKLLVKGVVAAGDFLAHDELPSSVLVGGSMVVDCFFQKTNVFNVILQANWDHIDNLKVLIAGSKLTYFLQKVGHFISLIISYLVEVSTNDNDHGARCSQRDVIEPRLEFLDSFHAIFQVEE